MNNLVWEVFKKTGNIEAYLYLRDSKNLESDVEELRENASNYDNAEHTGDST